MEDVKIWRNLRRKIVNRALFVSAVLQRLVGPNPDRIALHIYGSATFGQDVRLWDGAPTTSANIIATYCPSAWVETQLTVYDGGGANPFPYPVPIRPWIPHIRDYGDAITGEIWIDSFAGSFTVSVWELILDARTAAQLKGDGP